MWGFCVLFQIKRTFLSLNKLITRLLENMYQLQTLHSSRRNVRVIDRRMFLPELNDVIKEFRLEAHIICNLFHTRDVFWNNYINTTFHIMFKNVYYMFVTVSLVWSSGLFVLWVKHMIAGSSEVSRIISFLGIHQIPEVEAICHTTGVV